MSRLDGTRAVRHVGRSRFVSPSMAKKWRRSAKGGVKVRERPWWLRGEPIFSKIPTQRLEMWHP